MLAMYRKLQLYKSAVNKESQTDFEAKVAEMTSIDRKVDGLDSIIVSIKITDICKWLGRT